MKFMRILLPVFLILLLASFSIAQQKAEVTISLNEAFFDAALDAVFQRGGPLEFAIAENNTSSNPEFPSMMAGSEANFFNVSHQTFPTTDRSVSRFHRLNTECAETIKIQREMNGVRTSVRFRDGKIFAPIAFTGNYDPPFIGCVPFGGLAESLIDLEFDRSSQRLIAKARVLNVSLNGTGGVGGTVIARMVQSSIDKKINPIEIIKLDKLTFAVPIKGSNGVQMKATGIRYELVNGSINIVVSYDFV